MKFPACSYEHLIQLQKKHKEKEELTLSESICPDDKYLCIRLDGIKASKIYLKDTVVNKLYNESFHRAINTVYYLLRNQTEKENLFYGIFVASDEVSFIINIGHNYYGNRLYKIATTLSGCLSSAITLELMKEKNKAESRVVAFDARPLILESIEEVDEYCHFRWYLNGRNAMNKILRLKSELTDDDIYETELRDNIELLAKEIKQRELTSEYKKITKTFTYYKPNDKRRLSKGKHF